MCRVRPCKRWNIPTFIFLQNSKHILFCIFHVYRIYPVKIEFLFSQNTRSNSNFNWIYNYNYSMQGPSAGCTNTFGVPRVRDPWLYWIGLKTYSVNLSEHNVLSKVKYWLKSMLRTYINPEIIKVSCIRIWCFVLVAIR